MIDRIGDYEEKINLLLGDYEKCLQTLYKEIILWIM